MASNLPIFNEYTPGESRVAAAEQQLLDKDAIVKLLKENLRQSRPRMKQQADRHRSEQEFKVGDMVYLQLQPFCKHLYQCE